MFSVRPSVRSSVYQTHEHDMLKSNESNLLQIGTQVVLAVRGSKVKVTRRQSYIWSPGGGIVLDPFDRVGFLQFVYLSSSVPIWTNKNAAICWPSVNLESGHFPPGHVPPPGQFAPSLSTWCRTFFPTTTTMCQSI